MLYNTDVTFRAIHKSQPLTLKYESWFEMYSREEHSSLLQKSFFLIFSGVVITIHKTLFS
jgi:hypothetical protein